MSEIIDGFSKLSKEEKVKIICDKYFKNSNASIKTIKDYWNKNSKIQKLHDEFTENTISNFYMPLSIAPNFLIDGEFLAIPMVIEESSVVAAAASSAKFWSNKGGFKTKIFSTEKVGHVHFEFEGKKKILIDFFNSVKDKLLESTSSITKNMKKRGGGITSADLIDKSFELRNYYQIEVKFETIDSMGANFINSCLEQIAETLKKLASNADLKIDVIMSILSNYVPMCIVESSVSCSIDEIGVEFANKFIKAVEIANSDVSRAVTHNKGIMNGVDAVVIATGNDFRAVAAGVHAYAAKDGKYKSLSKAEIINDTFKFSIRLPLALGTVGGLTNLHPLVKWCHELLGNPNAKKLMSCVASTGLAQNFAAVKSLITTGIQKGHMKMHLLNILNQLDANEKEKNLTVKFFKDKKISYHDVANFIKNLRLK